MASNKASVSNFDFSDREILHLLKDNLNAEGVATAKEVSLSMGYGEDAAHHVGARLGWMRRYGLVDIEDRKEGSSRWTVTDYGRDILTGSLTQSEIKGIDSMSDAKEILVMERLALNPAEEARRLLLRQWRHSTGW